MGLLDRLNLLIRSNINLITGGDDPEDDTSAQPSRHDILNEVNATLQDARRQTAQLMRDERRLEREQQTLRADIQRWEDRALAALQADDEASARDALIVKHRANQRLLRVEEELTAVRTYLTDLLRSTERLESKRDTLRVRPAAIPSASSSAYTPATYTPTPSYTPTSYTSPTPAPWPSPQNAFDDTARRWESIVHRPLTSRASSSSSPDPSSAPAFTDADASLAAFERVASQIDSYEARTEATAALTASTSSALDPDDPLYDARLADLEARFRHLEAEQRRRG
jgi:phage shock protein A